MHFKRFLVGSIAFIFSFFSLFAAPAQALDKTSTLAKSIQPYLDQVADRVQEFSLDNGMKFIVLEEHQAPVVSFVTYADVGGVDEPNGKTGVAHFLEHLAFKGTKQIGTTNYRAEEKELELLDRTFDRLKDAQKMGRSEEIATLQAEFQKIQTSADRYVKQNEFGQIVETAGGVGLNATTGTDYTIYFYSFPSNKLELWMSLESERFLEPVFREFYKEKEVILEERRMRTDNSPIGKTIEAFLDTAYTKHPYKRPVIGYPEDIRNLTRQDVRDFFETYYSPNNLTVAIVGDVDTSEVRKLAQVYFGRFQAKSKTSASIPEEPPQTTTKEVTLKLQSEPWYLEGYHRPSINDRDDVVYEALAALLSDGRSSRLYKSLVEEKQVALSAEGINSFPGDKYPNLILFYALTAPDRTVEDVAKALEVELDRLKTEPVKPEELERFKTQAKAGLLRTLDSNMGMARLLAEYQAKTGSWRNLFEKIAAIDKVTVADVQRVALSTFTPENRTIGRLLNNN